VEEKYLPELNRS